MKVEGKWAVAGGLRHVCHGHVERRPVWIKCRSLDMPATVLPDCSAMQHPFGSAAKSVPNSNLLFVHQTCCDSAASFQVALCHKDGNRGLPDVCGNESIAAKPATAVTRIATPTDQIPVVAGTFNM